MIYETKLTDLLDIKILKQSYSKVLSRSAKIKPFYRYIFGTPCMLSIKKSVSISVRLKSLAHW